MNLSMIITVMYNFNDVNKNFNEFEHKKDIKD